MRTDFSLSSFLSRRRRHTRWTGDWSSDVCSSDLALKESDAGAGIANQMHLRKGDTATALPSGLLTAATWSPELAYASGAVLGQEARDRGYNVVLGGAMNLAREPRGGRTFEYAGEDPLLAGTIVG